MQTDKFQVEQDSLGDIIILPRESAVLMTYYRNNTIHLMVTPSLIASIVLHHERIHRDDLMKQVGINFSYQKLGWFYSL